MYKVEYESKKISRGLHLQLSTCNNDAVWRQIDKMLSSSIEQLRDAWARYLYLPGNTREQRESDFEDNEGNKISP